MSRLFISILLSIWLLGTCSLARAQWSSEQLEDPIEVFKHVFVVIEDGASYSSVVGNPEWAYLNSLIPNGVLLTQVYANEHPGLANYLWLTSGGNDGVTLTTPCGTVVGPLSQDNAIRQMTKDLISWKVYAESLPTTGFMGCQSPDGQYVQWHNPVTYFTDLVNSTAAQQNIVPFSQFTVDFEANDTAQWNLIIPNIHNDGGGGASIADAWLAQKLPELLQSQMFQPTVGKGLLIIVFANPIDDTGQVFELLIGPMLRAGYQSTTLYRHESTLRTTLMGLGLGDLPQAVFHAPDMEEAFVRQLPAIPNP